ncbi:MAG: pyridoxine 5'-phosphate synthase [Candidatus Methylacidiphilales bacterium]|nr:pyridoxine 5'-phosphate synthase [Candidatus Methylacidiphilales bacterium]
MSYLGVNIDHVATLRQARYRGWEKGLPPEPDVVAAAKLAEQAGAHGITVHLREDRRHIQDADVSALRKIVKTRLNLEMALTKEMVEKALGYMPDEVCLVPESREEVTTEGGLNMLKAPRRTQSAITLLNARNILVSAFIDADLDQVAASADAGAGAVELHTGTFANATTKRARVAELNRHRKAFEAARSRGLQVNAGHGLHYTNLAEYLTALPGVHTLNIGHGIISRAIFVGLKAAIQEMQEIISHHAVASALPQQEKAAEPEAAVKSEE